MFAVLFATAVVVFGAVGGPSVHKFGANDPDGADLAAADLAADDLAAAEPEVALVARERTARIIADQAVSDLEAPSDRDDDIGAVAVADAEAASVADAAALSAERATASRPESSLFAEYSRLIELVVEKDVHWKSWPTCVLP